MKRKSGKPIARVLKTPRRRAAPPAVAAVAAVHAAFDALDAARGTKKGRYIEHMSSAERKEHPITTGLLDYFPDACAAVANISFKGNQKHNPGQPMHHARGKSMDHADCIARHLTERGGVDPEGNRHSAQLAWRAFALLQEELENEFGLPLPRGAKA